MRRRTILVITTLAVLLIALGGSVAYRIQQVPSLLTVTVDLYLSRFRNQSYVGGPIRFLVDLTSANETYDNVTLVPGGAYGSGNLTSEAYWRLQIVLNESTTTNHSWEHNIAPGSGTAGQYSGSVSTSFAVRGNFIMWIILWSVYDGSTTILWWTSEPVRVYDLWF